MLNKSMIACVTLAQIRHNGTPYAISDVVCLSENDKLFLEKAGYVRVATPDEVAEFEQKQTNNNQVGENNPPNANLNSHLDNGASVGDDSEPTPPVSEPAQTEPSQAEPVANEPQSSEGTPPAEPVSEPVPALAYDKLTKAELVAQLTARGITHNPKAKNDELVALLVAFDAKTDEPVMVAE
ncbi:MAG: hypothetical protein Q4G13_00215 [Moraxella sp.]|nr:hypothetical protein [Moraxella sp.]